MQHPTSNILQRKPDLLKDPSSVLWDVTWKDINRIERASGKNDIGRPSRLNLHLYEKVDSKETFRVVKCDPSTDQADEVFTKIQQVMAMYAPDMSHIGMRVWPFFLYIGILLDVDIVVVMIYLYFISQSIQHKNVQTPYSGPTHHMAPSASFEDAVTDSYLPSIPTFSSQLDTPS